jgi:hypothetical protein
MSTTDPDTTAAKQNFWDDAIAADRNEMIQAMTILWARVCVMSHAIHHGKEKSETHSNSEA